MARYTAEIDVAAPPDEAFAYLADPLNRAEWDGSIREIAACDGASGAVGDRYDVTVGFYGKAIDGTYEIAESAAPTRIVFVADGRFDGRDTIEIVPSSSGSTVRIELEVKLKGMARLLDRGLGVAFAGIGDNAAAGIRKALGNLPQG